MTDLALGYGHESIELSVPSSVSYDMLKAQPLSSVSLERAFDEAWAHPHDMTDPLAVFAPGDRVAIVVNDHTRPTPTRDLLEQLWNRIKDRISSDRITIVVGTGTHRAPTESELESMLGPFRSVFDVRIHDCDHDLVAVGTTSRGTQVLVNRVIAEADRVIAIGHIGSHYYAGYSGGRKGILPGVAGRATIEANHAQFTDPQSRPCLYQGNPVSDEMVEAASMVPFSLTVDVALASDGGVAGIFIGDPEAAHAAGRAFWDAHFQAPFSAPYDVVIASAGGHPKDINLYQSHKALYNAMRTVRDGGILYLAAACPDGIGQSVFADWVHRCPRPEDVAPLYEREGFVLGGHKALYLAQDAQRATIFLHSEIDDETVRQFYMKSAHDLEAVFSAARSQFGDTFRTLVIPHAADTLPVPAA